MQRYAAFTVDTENPFPGAAFGALLYADLFESLSIRGTFYVSWDVLFTHPELVQELHRRGHEIGSHGTEHPYSCQPPNEWPPFLTELADNELEARFDQAVTFLDHLGVRDPGFRAMWFRADERVLGVVRNHFSYDSSLTRNQIRSMKLPQGLREIPLSTIRGTNIKFGTPIMYGPLRHILNRYADGLSQDSDLILYGHSFDLVAIPKDLPFNPFKRVWYYNKCGPEMLPFLERFLRRLIEGGHQFLPARELV